MINPKEFEFQASLAKALIPYRNKDNNIDFNIDLSKLPFKDEKKINHFINLKRAKYQGIYGNGALYEEGLKLFRLSNIDFEALENMAISLTVEDYYQPFRNVVIELPKNYAENRIFKFAFPTELESKITDHIPLYVGLTFDPIIKYLISILYYKSEVTSVTSFFDLDRTIEDAIKDRMKGFHEKCNNEAVDNEVKMTSNIMRAAINACMLMDEAGVKRIGPMNPKHYNRIRNKAEKKMHPIIFDFDQKITIYDRESTSNDPGPNDSESTKSVHWRRGHWRIQRHGPELSLRKRIRIKPVLVNAHRFVGNKSNTLVIYSGIK